jgi:putative transposase
VGPVVSALGTLEHVGLKRVAPAVLPPVKIFENRREPLTLIIMFWRRRLPHWVPDGSDVFVTWRLAGELPPSIYERCPWGETFRTRDLKLAHVESGHHWLKDPRIARTIEGALTYGATQKGWYELLAWVVMSNHVHMVIEPHKKLSEIMRWLKTATSVRANRILHQRGGPFWQREYYDHWIRSGELDAIVQYVEENPVSAGLVTAPEQWIWSSAHAGRNRRRQDRRRY